MPNPKDCKLFFLCGKEGEAVLASCPPNMLFNSKTKLCDNPENVECEQILKEESTLSPIQTPTAAASTINSSSMEPSQAEEYCYNFNFLQRNSQSLIFLPHTQNCQQYYMCYHGQALLQSCSPKLYWNSRLNKCDLPANVECLKSSIGEGEEEEEGVEIDTTLEGSFWQDSIKCPLYGEHIFPNIKRCDSFIYCVKGQAILQSCPFYQNFDVETGRCRWRTKAKCVKDLNLKYRKRN